MKNTEKKPTKLPNPQPKPQPIYVPLRENEEIKRHIPRPPVPNKPYKK